eukprot:7578510-Lingulodinium_polyedra.AAC.1
MLGSLGPTLDNKVSDACDQQKALQAERNKITKDLCTAEKRRRRLRTRCKGLPVEGLLKVLAMR